MQVIPPKPTETAIVQEACRAHFLYSLKTENISSYCVLFFTLCKTEEYLKYNCISCKGLPCYDLEDIPGESGMIAYQCSVLGNTGKTSWGWHWFDLCLLGSVHNGSTLQIWPANLWIWHSWSSLVYLIWWICLHGGQAI